MTDLDTNRYADLLALVKGRVREARVRAGLAANAELILVYWDIGTTILQRQAEEGWGAEVIQRLSRDLRREFPEMQGFSERNLKYMRKLAEVYPDREKVQQLVAQIPWGHTLHLLHKVKNEPARDWYIRQTVEHGWSRNVMALHIDAQDYERRGQAVTNFSRTLPSSQSDLARDILKNPYLFDFLGLADDMRERELESALLGHLREFLAVSHDDQSETDGEVAEFVRELAGEYRLANRSECP